MQNLEALVTEVVAQGVEVVVQEVVLPIKRQKALATEVVVQEAVLPIKRQKALVTEVVVQEAVLPIEQQEVLVTEVVVQEVEVVVQEVEVVVQEALVAEVEADDSVGQSFLKYKKMKRYYITILTVLICAITTAQNIDEVLRFSSENFQGTARFQGMSGAFGALGGNLSALNVNPAGSAIFNNNLFTFSGTNYKSNNDALYFNITENTVSNSLKINQMGGVFIYNNTNNSTDWKKFALAFNYDVVQNFDNKFSVSGRGNEGIDNYFLNFAQGIPIREIKRWEDEYIEEAYLDIGTDSYFNQQAFLGYYGGILDPVAKTDDNTEYISNAKYHLVDQKFLQRTSGHNSKFTINLASQYQRDIYIGASLNFYTIIYDKRTEFTETGYDLNSKIQRSIFDNLLHTEGNGFSFDLGIIAKLNKDVRVGGSYRSPVWYGLKDETAQRINSDLADDDINDINFNIVNIYEKYTVKIPEKLTASIAIIFGKEGLLSFDYGYQDMSRAELGLISDDSFSMVNSTISNELGAVSSFRLGGEYRIDRISLRGGYRFEQSPYVKGKIKPIGDLTGYSAGIGYNFSGSRLDLAFSHSEQDIELRLFDTGITTAAKINAINTNITVGYTINLF